jgi:hypothetical protein
MKMNLEELEKQVTLMEDIQEIENLQRMYGYYFDLQRWQDIVDLFSDNAESVEIVDHGLFKGKEGVRKMYYDWIGRGGQPNPFPPWVQFVIVQIGGVVSVSPDGKTAQGRWQTWLAEAKPYGAFPRQEWLHGYYENRYVKENGKWLFSKLHWNQTICTPFEDGWLKTPLMGLMNRHPTVKPDAPATAFHPYPSGYHLPYHYEHPITSE